MVVLSNPLSRRASDAQRDLFEGVSLDSYIAGPDGDISAPPPDEEVFRFVTDEIRQVGVHLLGRKLYETMLYWETADQDP